MVGDLPDLVHSTRLPRAGLLSHVVQDSTPGKSPSAVPPQPLQTDSVRIERLLSATKSMLPGGTASSSR